MCGQIIKSSMAGLSPPKNGVPFLFNSASINSSFDLMMAQWFCRQSVHSRSEIHLGHFLPFTLYSVFRAFGCHKDRVKGKKCPMRPVCMIMIPTNQRTVSDEV